MKVLAAALGNCVHVAGIQAFLDMARGEGYETVFLGPAVPVDKFVAAIREQNPDLVAVGYRLSPESAKTILEDLKTQLSSDPSLLSRRFMFGGTPPVCVVAAGSGLFEAIFDGNQSREQITAVLRRQEEPDAPLALGRDLESRIRGRYPYPLIRHHFGLPNLQDTIAGVRKIAESRMVDILSIAPDQNAQESFFRAEEMDERLSGSGGVPIRKPEDLMAIREAALAGNHPLLRCYSGTRDLVKWGEMLKNTINIAWGAVPLFWYSELDGRSSRTLRDAITENQQTILWYADNRIPVEVNDSHQWALRACGDTIELATAYLAAYNAKALGVKTYICQFMFDTPKGISPAMDLAKMLAKAKLVESLANGSFQVVRMVRPGLASMSTWSNFAKGQLAASVFASMAIKPHIVHVVGFSEADHASTADELIESCAIARGAIEKALLGLPRSEIDPAVSSRKEMLLADANLLIGAIKRVGLKYTGDPLTNPETLAEAVRLGLLDAADLRGGKVARGTVATRVVGGACVTIDKVSGKPIGEAERIGQLASSEEDLDLTEL